MKMKMYPRWFDLCIVEAGGPAPREELFHKLLWYGCRRSGIQELAKRGDVEGRVDVEGDNIVDVELIDNRISHAIKDLLEMGLVYEDGERNGQPVYKAKPMEQLSPEQRSLLIRVVGDDE